MSEQERIDYSNYKEELREAFASEMEKLEDENARLTAELDTSKDHYADITMAAAEVKLDLIAKTAECERLRGLHRAVNDCITPLPDFLIWIADRLVHVHGENANIDFVHSLRDRSKLIGEALTEALRYAHGQKDTDAQTK